MDIKLAAKISTLSMWKTAYHKVLVVYGVQQLHNQTEDSDVGKAYHETNVFICMRTQRDVWSISIWKVEYTNKLID